MKKIFSCIFISLFLLLLLSNRECHFIDEEQSDEEICDVTEVQFDQIFNTYLFINNTSNNLLLYYIVSPIISNLDFWNSNGGKLNYMSPFSNFEYYKRIITNAQIYDNKTNFIFRFTNTLKNIANIKTNIITNYSKICVKNKIETNVSIETQELF